MVENGATLKEVADVLGDGAFDNGHLHKARYAVSAGSSNAMEGRQRMITSIDLPPYLTTYLELRRTLVTEDGFRRRAAPGVCRIQVDCFRLSRRSSRHPQTAPRCRWECGKRSFRTSERLVDGSTGRYRPSWIRPLSDRRNSTKSRFSGRERLSDRSLVSTPGFFTPPLL